MDDQQASELEALERVLTNAGAQPIRLSYPLMKSMTRNFSEVIGRGGFGVVYMGFLPSGKVAVKRLSLIQECSDELFSAEINCLLRVNHKNIVRFLGYCSDTQGEVVEIKGRYVLAEVRQRLLCFEYVPNGNLHAYLKEKSHGDGWEIRYQMVNGICQGLKYLHTERINHLDLKPQNILLDACMEPRITDFGVSRCFDEGISRVFTKSAPGTLGYIAPETIDRGEISFKSDIYGLGIIIIKLLTGCHNFDYHNWHKSIDLHGPQVTTCIQIARTCIDVDQHKRPNICDIIDKLNKTDNMIQRATQINQCPRNVPGSSIYQIRSFHPNELIQVDRIKLPFGSENVLELTNIRNDHVAFIVMVLASKVVYFSERSRGILPPGSSQKLVQTRVLPESAPLSIRRNGIFFVRGTIVSPCLKTSDITLDMFNSEAGRLVHEVKLSVILSKSNKNLDIFPVARPRLPSSEARRHTPPPVSSTDNQDHEKVEKEVATILQLSVHERSWDTNSETSSSASNLKKLIQVDPLEFRFPCQQREVSSSLKIVNITDDYVAFKLRTRSRAKYKSSLRRGVLPPRSTQDIMQTRVAQGPLPDAECKESVLVQCTVVRDGFKATDITNDIFEAHSGKLVHEVEINIVLVAQSQPVLGG
ncbi:hypothetical protein ACQ4PT_006721 [Festuca glaucescens]